MKFLNHFLHEGKRNQPIKYTNSIIKIISQIEIKTSRFKIPQCATKSAFERNFNASANSRKPNVTFNLVIQPPDLGIDFRALGKRASKPKGNAKAIPNPAIPEVNSIAPPSTVMEPTNSDPKIGPVHEKDTIANVNAIKNVPIIPPIEAKLSERLTQVTGKVSS